MGKTTAYLDIQAAVKGGDAIRGLSSDLGALQAAVNRVETDTMKRSFTDFATTAGAVSVALQGLSSAMRELTADYKSFDSAMRRVNTMAGRDAAGFSALKEQVTDLSQGIGLAREELANGLYETISNGVPEADQLKFLEASARSAVGGYAELGGVVTVTSTIIKNYGEEWSKAAAIQDKIQKTAQNGVTSFEQLQQALPRVTGNAAALGVSIDELLATFATLTGVTGNTAEVSTQLAAVFTALIKPSSQAVKLAKEMGIQFDAAAIKGAGGMANFLRSLDKSVQSYAAKTGQLSQTIYGELFGSAESLRAIGGLTGQLRDKFVENISAMADSAGTMSFAFEQANADAEHAAQIRANNMSAITDMIAQAVAPVQPLLTLTATMGLAVSGIGTMVGAAIKLGTALKALSLAAVRVVPGLRALRTTIVGYQMACTVGTGATYLLATAVRGLLIASGIGAAIWAVSAAIDYLSTSSDEAAGKVGGLGDEMEKRKPIAEEIADTTAQAAAKELAALDQLWNKYSDVNASMSERQAAVDEMHRKWPSYISSINAERGSVDALKKEYLKLRDAIDKAARARALGNLLTQSYERKVKAELALDNANKAVNDYGALASQADSRVERDRKAGKTTITTHQMGALGGMTFPAKNANVDQSEHYHSMHETAKRNRDTAKRELDQATRDTAVIRDKLAQLGKVDESVLDKDLSTVGGGVSPSAKTGKTGKKGTAKTAKTAKTATEKKDRYANPVSKEQAQHNLSIIDKELNAVKNPSSDNPRYKQLMDERSAVESLIEAYRLVEIEYERPAKISSLDDVEKESDYWQSMRRIAKTDDARAEIDKEIAKVEELRESMDFTWKPVKVTAETDFSEVFDTLDKLDDEIAKADKAIGRTSVPAQLEYLQSYKTLLEQVRETRRQDLELSTMQKTVEGSVDLDKVRTKADLEKVMAAYQAKAARATGEELYNIQRILQLLQGRVDNLDYGADLAAKKAEAARVSALPDKEYKLTVRGMGFEQLQSDIDSLTAKLASGDLTAGQREDIESLIATYKKWQAASVSSFDSLKDGWSAVTGVSQGITSLTDSLKNSKTVWEKVTAAISAAIQVYESVASALKTLNALGITHTAVKRQETAATAAGAAADAMAGAAKVGLAKSTLAAQTAATVLGGAANANKLATGAEAAAALLAAQAYQAKAVAATAAASGSSASASASTTAAAGNAAEATTGFAAAIANFFKAHSWIPFVGAGLAMAAVATMLLAAKKTPKVPKFEDGGIAFGPTLGLFGEYPNAKTNPEVVAPLDKLRKLIAPADGEGGLVEFRIQGDTLYGILDRHTRRRSRT